VIRQDGTLRKQPVAVFSGHARLPRGEKIVSKPPTHSATYELLFTTTQCQKLIDKGLNAFFYRSRWFKIDVVKQALHIGIGS